MIFILASCAQPVCPANARESQLRQLRDINSKRKRDRGLFPKSMHPSKRKYKVKKKEKIEIEEF